MLGYEDSQREIFDFLGGPGGPWGVETTNATATGLPTLCSSAHSTGMVWSPRFVGVPQLSRIEGHSRRAVRGVRGYSLRIHMAVGEGAEAMAAREPFHPEASTLSIGLTLL